MDIYTTHDWPQYVLIYDPVSFKFPLTQSALLCWFIVAAITQEFYCYRVYILAQSKCAVVLISTVSRDAMLVKNMLISINTSKALARTAYSFDIGGNTSKECSPVY